VSDVLTGRLQIEKGCRNSKGRPITLESAVTKFFMGVAFVIVAIALAVTGRGGGWWFYMLIPALMFVGGGIAQYMQIRRFEQGRVQFSAESHNVMTTSAPECRASARSRQTLFLRNLATRPAIWSRLALRTVRPVTWKLIRKVRR
jgi:hypothetical protein